MHRCETEMNPTAMLGTKGKQLARKEKEKTKDKTRGPVLPHEAPKELLEEMQKVEPFVSIII